MFKSLIRTFAIVAAFIAGYMMPGLHVYSWTFKWMLVVMLFVTFLGIRFKRMKPERAHWLLTGANLMVALAAWGVCRLVFGDGYLAQAAFFVGIMPTATAAPVVMGLLGGSVEFMLTALLLINGIICALLPFILPAVVGRGGFEIYPEYFLGNVASPGSGIGGAALLSSRHRVAQEVERRHFWHLGGDSGFDSRKRLL